MLPPMILFDLSTPPKRSLLQNIPKDWAVGTSDKGWMTTESFNSYIMNVFYKWLKKNNVVFPVILYVDGNSSHLNLQLFQFCQENDIELVLLNPNSTHIYQPLDVSVFRVLKLQYKERLRIWRVDNNVIDFKKNMFPIVLKIALDNYNYENSIKNGFRCSGLYPFNEDAVNFDILYKKKKGEILNRIEIKV